MVVWLSQGLSLPWRMHSLARKYMSPASRRKFCVQSGMQKIHSLLISFYRQENRSRVQGTRAFLSFFKRNFKNRRSWSVGGLASQRVFDVFKIYQWRRNSIQLRMRRTQGGQETLEYLLPTRIRGGNHGGKRESRCKARLPKTAN